MKHSCPVCGYGGLTSAPKDDMICPCCGTQFGYDDFVKTHEQIRREWLSRGALWFSRKTLPPAAWSADKQLTQAGLAVPAFSLSA